MVAGATGKNKHLLNAGKNVARFGTKQFWLDCRGIANHLKGGCNGAGLFVNLLLHVVRIGAQLHSIGGQLAFDDGALDLLTCAIKK